MDQDAIENELNCSICFDTYTDPKILQCFHVYCRKCLAKLVVRDQQGQLNLSCPICRMVTPVPASGTADLQSAFHINRLLEILDQHKKAKAESASAERADSKAESLCPSALYCSEHSRKEVELYCETCRKLICSMCAIKMGKHHSHDYMLIDESIERFKEEVTPYMKLLEKKIITGTEVLGQLDGQSEEISDQLAAIKADIRDTSKRLHEIIEKRENKLIVLLDQISRRKLKSLSTRRFEIETFQAQLSSCLEFTRESLKKGIEQPEVLTMKVDVVKQVRKLVTAPEPDILTLSAGCDTLFSGSADAAAVCESYGRVFTPNLLKHVSTTGQETDEVVVGKKATAFLICEGEPCQNVSAEVVSELTQCPAECSLKPRGEGRYVIKYQPTIKGRHQLHIKADGQHIRGSPFSVTVKLPVEKLGTPIKALKNVRNPWGVAVTGKGDVVVTEWGQHCVSVFTPDGGKQSFGKCGSGPGRFQHPSGVAVDGEGNILVADYSNHRIQKFAADGQFLKAGKLYFKPCHIAYNAINSMVYVVDEEKSCIQVMSSDLFPNGTFGKKGSGEGQLVDPCGVATDSIGRVYVADSGNHRIEIFTSEGEFLNMFGKNGAGGEELNCSFGIAVEGSDFVYISEYDNHRVSVFTSEGRFVTSFGSKGQEPGQFDTPRGLAVDSSGVVYVCDSPNRVQIF